MALSIATDYAADTGCPEPYLRRIAGAAFSHVHWCHEWNTDFLYPKREIERTRRWLDDFGLGTLDLHASAGARKSWGALEECRRREGIELVRNRIEMAAALSCDVIVLHIPGPPDAPGGRSVFQARLRESLDALEPFARARGVRIAFENGDLARIRRFLAEYDPSFLGLCYDSGHGNVDGRGLDGLEPLKDRLIAIHLHDNDGGSDQHRLPFTGTVDWPRLAGIIARSSYAGPVSLEVSMRGSGIADEGAFLRKAHEVATAFSRMVDEGRPRAGRT